MQTPEQLTICANPTAVTKKYGYVLWRNGICYRIGKQLFVGIIEVTPDVAFKTKAQARQAMKSFRWTDAVILTLKRCTDCSKLTFDLPFRRIQKCLTCRQGARRYGSSQKGLDRNFRYNHSEKGAARNRAYLDNKIGERALLREIGPIHMALHFKRAVREGSSRDEALAATGSKFQGTVGRPPERKF
jgi:hypothetical protein